MARKYLVIQLDPDANVGEIVESIREHTDRMAIIDKPPGEIEGIGASQSTAHTHTTGSEEDTSFDEDEFERQKSVKKEAAKRKRRYKEDEETKKPKQAPQIIVCQVCNVKQTMRPRYGRRRLVEHALRHLNIPSARCGDCDFQATTKQQVRRHCSARHNRDEYNVIDLELPNDYEDRVEAMMTACFPDDNNRQNLTINGDTIQVAIPVKIEDEIYLSFDEETIAPNPEFEDSLIEKTV